MLDLRASADKDSFKEEKMDLRVRGWVEVQVEMEVGVGHRKRYERLWKLPENLGVLMMLC